MEDFWGGFRIRDCLVVSYMGGAAFAAALAAENMNRMSGIKTVMEPFILGVGRLGSTLLLSEASSSLPSARGTFSMRETHRTTCQRLDLVAFS